MAESAVVISANDGVAIVVKHNNGQLEKSSPFKYCGGDPLVTKTVNSNFSLPSNVRKCEVKPLGRSSAIVMFGTAGERSKILNIVSSGIKKWQFLNRPFKHLCDHIGIEINKLGHSSSTSQHGGEVILTSWSPQNGCEVYGINSDGDCFVYHACAIGDDKDQLKLKLSYSNFEGLTTNQCLVEGLKILNEVTSNDIEFKFDAVRICSETQGVYEEANNELCNLISKEAEKF